MCADENGAAENFKCHLVVNLRISQWVLLRTLLGFEWLFSVPLRTENLGFVRQL